MTRRQLEVTAWTAGGFGPIGVAIAGRLEPAAVPHAWLAALFAWLEWPLGSMGLLLVHALTGGQWGHATRSQLVAGMMTLPLLPMALIPLIIVAPSLYPWLRPAADTQLGNAFYLNSSTAAARMVVYLVVWFGLAWAILRSLGQEASARALAVSRPRVSSCWRSLSLSPPSPPSCRWIRASPPASSV
jgi:hypothetical protein